MPPKTTNKRYHLVDINFGYPAIFFDRDGTLVETRFFSGKPRAENNIKHVKFINDSIETVNAASGLGYRCFLVTNQPDVFDGVASKKAVELVNDFVLKKAQLLDIACCYERASSKTNPDDCMKPNPKMIVDLAIKWDLDLSRSWVIGDQWKDVEAGSRAGCKTILIERFYSQTTRCDPTFVVQNIGEVIEVLRRSA